MADPCSGRSPDSSAAFAFYKSAKSAVIKMGFQGEIDSVDSRSLESTGPEEFFIQYSWVIINSGMKNAVAEKIWRRFRGTEGQQNIEAIGHPGKRQAIAAMYDNNAVAGHLAHMLSLQTDQERVDYLATLPWIGPITKYHLARNIGILGVAKPDRHLVRLAIKFGYGASERDLDAVQRMCQEISKASGDKVGVVDVIIWRFLSMLYTHDKPYYDEYVMGKAPQSKLAQF